MAENKNDIGAQTVERLRKMSEHVPREFDSMEDALVQQAASDGLQSINTFGSAASSRVVRSGERLIRVEVRVIDPTQGATP